MPNRRTFLKSLMTGLPSVLVAPAVLVAEPAQPASSEREQSGHGVIYAAGVRGLRYYRAGEAARWMKSGDPLTLKPEPDNPYDPYAIEIWWQEYKLGYVPRDENKALAGLMKNGHTLQARISCIDRGEYEWMQFKVMV